MRVHIPYFGIIKIAREGVSKEVPKQQATAIINRLAQSQVVDKSSTTTQMRAFELAGASGFSTVEVMTPVDAGSMISHEVPDTYAKTPGEISIPFTSANDATTTPQLQNGFYDPFLQNAEYPELAAVGEDWVFQGVDMAFFDSLMRSAGNEGNEDAEYTI